MVPVARARVIIECMLTLSIIILFKHAPIYTPIDKYDDRPKLPSHYDMSHYDMSQFANFITPGKPMSKKKSFLDKNQKYDHSKIWLER